MFFKSKKLIRILPCRYLSISFLENCNVRYRFSQRGFQHRISEYIIDYPWTKVILHEGQNVHTSDLCKRIMPNYHLALKWEKTAETQFPEDERIIEYEKMGYLNLISQDPLLFRYRERFSIDASEDIGFYLALHGPHRRMSALKKRAHAVFYSSSKGYIHCCNATRQPFGCWEERCEQQAEIPLQPLQLAGAKIHATGILDVDWVLEIDEREKK